MDHFMLSCQRRQARVHHGKCVAEGGISHERCFDVGQSDVGYSGSAWLILHGDSRIRAHCVLLRAREGNSPRNGHLVFSMFLVIHSTSASVYRCSVPVNVLVLCQGVHIRSVREVAAEVRQIDLLFAPTVHHEGARCKLKRSSSA